ncbi:hypothetical protein SAMN05518801_10914 [Novosphingobium sp. CF614]|nr:hypothetical protein SAMN05518801_10914 [Novosphingobium sp. CF614]
MTQVQVLDAARQGSIGLDDLSVPTEGKSLADIAAYQPAQ